MGWCCPDGLLWLNVMISDTKAQQFHSMHVQLSIESHFDGNYGLIIASKRMAN